ncbi:glycoside hydrolase family 76 protein [Periconia macrospinosa]|uniref:Mannan endo-1,6-alpha-mannosidase n=1 Tax=Periconia macrospinosa TaxID=97972 RepID=A0A2V1DWS7_9PLEO|nr:glycoside hydrolase family 76 protein [Periconia macrospinosa]
MLLRRPLLTLAACTLCVPTSLALQDDLDTNNQDSIKALARNLTNSIISRYNERLYGGAAGLFDNETLEQSYPFWEAGAIWGSLLEYGHLTGDTQYNSLVSQAIIHQLGNDNAFMSPNQTRTLGNEDQSSWALTALTAAEVGLPVPQGQSGQWIDFASNVFNTQVERWDPQACSGGLRWQIFSLNMGYDYMDAGSASNFFLLSARLARFTGNKTYTEWAGKAYQWAEDHKFIDKFQVYGGASVKDNCSKVEKAQWSMDHAVFTEGAAVMYNLTNGAEKWKNIVAGFANSTQTFINSTTKTLYEPTCEIRTCSAADDVNIDNVLSRIACMNAGRCSVEQRAYKGVAIRSYYHTMRYAPFSAEKLQSVASSSAKGAKRSCYGLLDNDSDIFCGFSWAEAPITDVVINIQDDIGEMHNALSAIQGLLWPQAKALASSNTSVGSTSNSNGGTQQNQGNTAKNFGGRVEASLGLMAVIGGLFLVGL